MTRPIYAGFRGRLKSPANDRMKPARHSIPDKTIVHAPSCGNINATIPTASDNSAAMNPARPMLLVCWDDGLIMGLLMVVKGNQYSKKEHRNRCSFLLYCIGFYRRERFFDDFLLFEAVVRLLLLDFANLVLRDLIFLGP